ncbi:hypothetical protein [Chamaesiphon sp.]|uniref:hypothetical protein n=1 Tax=Chamaesiphon sp. TaxID=2814140 RepID=UPI0035936B97
MTTDSDMDTSTNVMTDDSMDVNTGNSQPLTRTIGKPKQDKDPNALKIASFRTKEGVWAEFSAKAESDGLTATDVLKAAMDQYLSGEYDPRVIGISTTARHTNNGLTRNDVLEIVSTAISTERINSYIMTVVGTLSIYTASDVSTAIHTAIDLLRAEMNGSLLELETFTRSQLAAMRDELRAIADRATTEPIANPAQNLTKPDIDDVRETESIASPHNTDSNTPSDRVTDDPIANPTNTKPDRDTDKNPTKKTWGEFFKMVGIEAMPALDAQKKQDTDTRTQQIERGLQAARDLGLGEWTAKSVGRSFVRVDATPESPLPLFPN